jgi:indolepyruvate ferredoxin oxidoreductase
VGGVGGTGVITIGQLLGMAAHLEGKGVVGAGRRPAWRRRAAPPGATCRSPTGPEAIHTTKVDLAQADLRASAATPSWRPARTTLAVMQRRPHLRGAEQPRHAHRRPS